MFRHDSLSSVRIIRTAAVAEPEARRPAARFRAAFPTLEAMMSPALHDFSFCFVAVRDSIGIFDKLDQSIFISRSPQFVLDSRFVSARVFRVTRMTSVMVT